MRGDIDNSMSSMSADEFDEEEKSDLENKLK